ncbi:MAG: hypothetical protein JWO81_1932 [Alphaproteobacteria bacterium]|nr:hypothetical protein [Alphaproteobacteria bacterium]
MRQAPSAPAGMDRLAACATKRRAKGSAAHENGFGTYRRRPVAGGIGRTRMSADLEPLNGEVKSADAAAIRLLQWIAAALLLLNGGALVLVMKAHGVRGVFDGGGRSFAGGLLAALAGALFWALAYGALSRDRDMRARDAAQPGAPEPDTQETGELPKTLCAIAIMLWVGSLTGFITGCES